MHDTKVGYYRKKLVISLPGGRKGLFWKKLEETGRNWKKWKIWKILGKISYNVGLKYYGL